MVLVRYADSWCDRSRTARHYPCRRAQGILAIKGPDKLNQRGQAFSESGD